MHARTPDEHRAEQSHHQQDAAKDFLQQATLHAAVKVVHVTATYCRLSLHQQSNSNDHTDDDEGDGD